MKKFTLFLLLFAVLQIAKAQTVLKPGDIAIVQVNYSNRSFDFVPLVPLSTGTKIVFTDMKYSAATHKFIPFGNANYGLYTYTAPAPIGAGFVIQSKDNPNFVKNYDPMLFPTAGEGLTLIAFQQNDTTYVNPDNSTYTVHKDTTYLTALGWYKAENFKAGESDIPPGLDVLYNSVVKLDSTDLYYVKYRNFKFDDMGNATNRQGTAIQLRRRFADKSNFSFTNGTMNNTAVPNFNVLAPDIISPTLVSSYPTKNKINVSPYSEVLLKFSEPMIAKKAITIRNTTSGATQYVIPTDVTIQDSVVSFSYGADLEYATNYTLEFQHGTFTDLDNHPWPAVGDTIIPFATSAKRSIIDLAFTNRAKEDLKWITTSATSGYWSFSIDGIPMRLHGSISPTNPLAWITPGQLVVDLSSISNTITTVNSKLYANNVSINTDLYSQGNIVSNKSINEKGTGSSNLRYTSQGYDIGYAKQIMLNESAAKIDSIIFRCSEGAVLGLKIELIDLVAPVVELGANRTICQGDSVKLDAGFTPGAVYTWNTGATTQKITVKTTDTYSVTVKNTLGQRSDNVLVTVRPTISVSLPDTIYACVGDTVTLVAGTDVSNSYFWSPNGQTTPSIKVTQSGIYHVLVNNGFGGCFTTDSTRVIFKGARAHIGFNQGGMTGYNDVEGQLYRKNTNGKFEMYLAKNLPQFATFDSLPKGEYILKAHFVSYSFVGSNPFIDTYHDGKTEWSKVVPFKLTCETDTMFSFTLANKPTGYEFNGTGVISGKVVVSTPAGVRAFRVKSEITDTNGDILILLYDGNGSLIATTYPDANGNYSFTNLPAGNYSVGVERTGFTVQPLFTTALPTGGTVSNANFTVNEAAHTIILSLTNGVATISSGNFLQLSISPNPIKSSAKLLISSENADNITISVVDFTGRICKSLNRTIEQGVNVITLNNDGFSGIYLVKVSTSTKMIVQRVIFE